MAAMKFWPTSRTGWISAFRLLVMNIGKASKLTGVTPRMIRHYEASGIITGGRVIATSVPEKALRHAPK